MKSSACIRQDLLSETEKLVGGRPYSIYLVWCLMFNKLVIKAFKRIVAGREAIVS